MSVIKVSHLKKYYQIYQRGTGLWGSVKSLVSRKYSEVKAVDDASFTIDEGELVGFIGPNGAGKTTTLKVLSGILFPTAGGISVLGFRPFDRKLEFQKQISLVMGQKNQLWVDLPVIETFRLNKEIYEIPKSEYERNLAELVELLEIQDLLQVQVRKLSLGQRMKCELVTSLLHRPKVLFLDEPTIGLDVVMQKRMRDFIKEYNQRHQATILLTSHYMRDVAELCQRVIFINLGKIVYDGLLTNIVEKYDPHKRLRLMLSYPVELSKLEKVGKVTEYNFPKVEIEINRQDVAGKTAQVLAMLPVSDLSLEETPIEEVISRLFENQRVRSNTTKR